MGVVQGPRSLQLSVHTHGAGPAGRRRVLVARHGQTDWNRQGRYQGHGDPPLNEQGREQAAALAEELCGQGVTHVATSDLRRARETAAVLAARAGLEPHACPAFREVDLGTWEGLTEAEVTQRHPAQLRAWKAGEDVRRGGGERDSEAAQRFVAGLDRLLEGTGGDATPLVVAHGLVLRRAMERLVADGRLALPGPAPHLANGHWMLLALAPPQT